MYDYMIALMERFHIETPELAEYKAAVSAAEESLRTALDGDRRKLLLCLTDCHNTCRQLLYWHVQWLHCSNLSTGTSCNNIGRTVLLSDV